MKEIWKDIKGYEGLYQVSNLGRVNGVRRQGSCGGILKPDKKKISGYLRVTLCKNNKTKRFQIHRLVLEAFIGPRPSDNHFGMHKDNNPENNIYTNLKWGTPQENSDHRTASGNNIGAHLGNKHHYAKAKEEDIPKIRKLIKENVPIRIIAQKFNLSTGIIYHIKDGSCWGHIYKGV